MKNEIFFGYTKNLRDQLSVQLGNERKFISYSLSDLLQKSKSEILSILEKAGTLSPSQEEWDLCLDHQPVFASGVTFKISEEAIEKGLQEKPLYTKSYLSERPMIFFKSFPQEVVPSGGKIRLKKSAKRTIPESEVVILYNAHAEPIAISVGNDVTAVDIEKENSLYQPYAKYYQGSTSIGPCWRFLVEDMAQGKLKLKVTRQNQTAIEYEYSLEAAHRSFLELGRFLFEDRSFPSGVCLFYGCNRSLPPEFSLRSGDFVELSGSFLGDALFNTVE